MLIGFIIFLILALVMVGAYQFLNAPEEGWDEDPLPDAAEKGEQDAKKPDHLDLEI